METKKSVTIAVSGLNAIDSPGPGIPVIRGLRESEHFSCRIIGLAYENLEPGIYMDDIVDKVYTMPYPSEGTEAVFDKLSYIHERENLEVIIPNFDAEIYPYIRLTPRLSAMGISTFLPGEGQFEERQKHNLDTFGKKYGIPVPEGKAVHSLQELEKAGNQIEYPLMIKGKFYEAYIAWDAEAAKSWFHKVSMKWGLPVIVQKYIKGEEFNVTGLGDGQGRTIAAVSMRKQYITDKGKAWGGITVADPRLLALTASFVEKTRWRGPFELELMKDAQGVYHLMEINPRMPAWVYLAVGAGQNIPEAIVRLALGETLEPMKPYEVGKMFLRYSWDMIVDVMDFQNFAMKGERG